jgi:DICT domain-containing protein
MPDYNIDPQFSVFALVKRSLRDKAVMHHRQTMSLISKEIENASIIDNASNIVFSSFQRMSRFLPQEQRYRLLAAKSKHVYVFGEIDCELPKIANLSYVPLKPSDQLAKEWFIVSFGHDYFSALATEELSHIDDPDTKRIFKGVWTFDVFVVGILHEWLSSIVGLRLEQRLDDSHDYLKQAELITNAVERMEKRMEKFEGDKAIILKELQGIMDTSLSPTVDTMKTNPTVETLKNVYRSEG